MWTGVLTVRLFDRVLPQFVVRNRKGRSSQTIAAIFLASKRSQFLAQKGSLKLSAKSSQAVPYDEHMGVGRYLLGIAVGSEIDDSSRRNACVQDLRRNDSTRQPNRFDRHDPWPLLRRPEETAPQQARLGSNIRRMTLREQGSKQQCHPINVPGRELASWCGASGECPSSS